MDLPKILTDEIIAFCKANDILDVDGFIIKVIKIGFNIEKYGAIPSFIPEVEVKKIPETIIEKESVPVVNEKQVEVINTPNKIETKDIYGEN
jgi:hypothetical protein